MSSHRFKSGKHAGRTVEQVLLKDPAFLYSVLGPWSDDKPHLGRLVREFHQLRDHLAEAKVCVRCSDGHCSRTPMTMTFPVDKHGELQPGPYYYWCKRHEPWEGNGISRKLPISLDIIQQVNRRSDKNSIGREIVRVCGLPLGTRITERFAAKFFAKLRHQVEHRH
jgi:hypothetical protein